MRKQLLLMEDDQVFAQVLCRSLEKKSIDTFHISRVEQVNELPIDVVFDYVVLDLMLEDKTSLTVLRDLRVRYPLAKILILTGYASIVTTVQAIKLGADNYLPKPATSNQILKALNDQAEQELESHILEPLSVERLQWEHIQKTLAEHEGNISATARALDMHRRTLQRRLAKKPKNK